MGHYEDWELLLNKTIQLKQYAAVSDWNDDLDGVSDWNDYVDGLLPILKELLQTYQGQPNLTFWKQILKIESQSGGYITTQTISGWILKLYYPYYQESEIDSEDLKFPSIEVPLKIVNEFTVETKDTYLLGGFGGISYENGAFRPQQSFILVEPKNVIEKEMRMALNDDLGTEFKDESLEDLEDLEVNIEL